MKRKQALAVIVADVAQHGVAGKTAIRVYAENRISRKAFNEACRTGMAIYNRGVTQHEEG